MTSIVPHLPDDSVQLTTMLLAERAEVLNGKLYLHGGGFDRVAATMPLHADFSLAVVLEVPWVLLETPYEVRTETVDADGTPCGRPVRAEVESHPPEGWRAGVPLTVPLVFPVMATLDHPGRYAIRCLIDGDEAGRTGFELLPLDARPPAPEEE